LILTLFITVISEGLVVTAYCLWRRKPARPLLLTSICINILTQSLLWLGLNLFFREYLLALMVAEVLIWGIESVLLYGVASNGLQLREAVLLSLSMNLISFVIGWFLPV
jgi:hypothetical protein